MRLLHKILAEFFGTFALVLVGTGAIVINDTSSGAVTHLGISIAFGAVVTLMILVFGKISGAHINPAVTLGFWATGDFNIKLVLPYLIAQFLGGIGASLFITVLFPSHLLLGATIPTISLSSAFILEFLLTLFLMLVILWVSYGNSLLQKLASWAIGASVFLEAYFAGPLTGASMNPARTLGPALISGNLEHLWIYLTATTLGAISAVFGFKLIKRYKINKPIKNQPI